MKRLISRFFFLVLVPVTGLGIAGYYYLIGGQYLVTENAYVKSRLVHISSDIDGRVVKVNVHNNQNINQGDILFQIDPEPAEIELMAARAEVGSIRQRITSLKSQYKQTLLDIDNVEETNKFLASQLERHKKLKQQGHGLEIDFERAQHDLEMGRRALVTSNQRSAIVLADIAGDPDLPVENHALFLAAQAKVYRALRNLELTSIIAPSSGILSNVTLESGEYVKAGDVIFSIVGSDQVWIEANLKESQLTHLQEGQNATIIVDAYPDLVFSGVVTSVSPATGAEFAVLPPQNATGNWVKVVQRIPVRLDLFQNPDDPPLRAGMTTKVTINTLHERKLPRFLQSVMAAIKSEK